MKGALSFSLVLLIFSVTVVSGVVGNDGGTCHNRRLLWTSEVVMVIVDCIDTFQLSRCGSDNNLSDVG